MRRIAQVEWTPLGLVAVADDGTLWIADLWAKESGPQWSYIQGPPDGTPNKIPRVRLPPTMVVGPNRTVTQEDVDRFTQKPA